MRVELLNMRGPGVGGTTPGGLMAQWRVGAVIEAMAVRDAVTGQLFLAVGAARLPARIASGDVAGPADGEQLKLRVLRNSPVLALETLNEPAGQDLTGDALRRTLPRQSSPAPLLANLAWLARIKPQDSPLPEPVTRAAVQLWQALPSATELGNADGLAQALARSGAFLESTLARGQATAGIASTDLKALLLTFKETLLQHGARPQAAHAEPLPQGPLPMLRDASAPLASAPASLAVIDEPAAQLNELGRQAEGMLARITTTQLVNLEATNPPVWLLELPLQRDDRAEVVRFRFEQQNGQQGHEAAWTVDAALDLGIGGALHARVSLQGQRIAVQLRAESAPLVRELTARADELAAVLRASGLNVDRVVCLHGMPADDGAARSSRLLDVRA